MAHGFTALGEAAERAVSTISALAADAAQAPSRLGNVTRLLTANGKLSASTKGARRISAFGSCDIRAGYVPLDDRRCRTGRCLRRDRRRR